MCEFDWIRRHLSRRNQSVVRTFQYTKRYIDDILSADNPDFMKYAVFDDIHFDDGSPAGIYPRFLTLNLEQSGIAVSFLDLFIYFSKRIILVT